jgi:DMSO/TMAO reductase YedYZ molybdopterin-dependent catalytic subunit
VIRASLARRLRRRPWDRTLIWGVIGATGLALGMLLGLAWTLNLISFETLWGYSPLNIHVIFGIGLLPFVGWHAWKRRRVNAASAPVRSRRAAVRLAGLGGVALAGWQAIQQAAPLLNAPGARRATGSKFAAALSGNAYPAEIWLLDRVPSIDVAAWRLHVSGLVQSTLSFDDLQTYAPRQVQAVLDCTGGWWTEQIWSGVPLLSVLERAGMGAAASQVAVVSTTGHRIVFSVADLDEAILATHVGDEPLSAAHGYPVRLAVPGRRGYQWVKWVEHIVVT